MMGGLEREDTLRVSGEEGREDEEESTKRQESRQRAKEGRVRLKVKDRSGSKKKDKKDWTNHQRQHHNAKQQRRSPAYRIQQD